MPSSPTCPADSASPPGRCTPTGSKVAQAGRSYDLQERRRTGNMTAAEHAHYERIPTDESEAQMLPTVDLDGIKSEYLRAAAKVP